MKYLPLIISIFFSIVFYFTIGAHYMSDTTSFMLQSYTQHEYIGFHIAAPLYPTILDFIQFFPVQIRSPVLILIQHLALLLCQWQLLKFGNDFNSKTYVFLQWTFIAGMILAFYTPNYLMANVLATESLYMSFMIISILLILRAFIKKKISLAILGGALAGLATALRFVGIVFPICFLIAIICTFFYKNSNVKIWQNKKIILTILTAYFFIILSTMLFCKIKHGNWKIVHGKGIHGLDRLGIVDKILIDNQNSRKLISLAQKNNIPKSEILVTNAGFKLHQMLILNEDMSWFEADDFLQKIHLDVVRNAPLIYLKNTFQNALDCIIKHKRHFFVQRKIIYKDIQPSSYYINYRDMLRNWDFNNITFQQFQKMYSELAPHKAFLNIGPNFYLGLATAIETAHFYRTRLVFFFLIAMCIAFFILGHFPALFLGGLALAQLLIASFAEGPEARFWEVSIPLFICTFSWFICIIANYLYSILYKK